MKKIISILIILLVSTSAFGQIYPVDPSLDSIRTFAYYKLNIPTAGTGNITNVKANMAINMALGKLCTDLPAYEKVDTLYMTSDSDGVILPTDFTRMANAFRMYDSMLIPMKEILHDSLYQIFVIDSSGNSQNKSSFKSPSYYRINARKFFTHPKVSKADTFIVNYYALQAELTAGTDSITFESKYFDEFMTLVKAEILEIRDR